MSTPITISSNADDVVRKLHGFPLAMAAAISASIDEQNDLTIGYAQQNKLSGPRPGVLGVVTNRLRGSLTAAPARQSGNEIISAIGTNVKYAAVHEFGFDGDVEVKEYTRRVLSKTSSKYSLFDPKTGRISKGKKKVRAVLDAVTVRAHTRHMHMPARPFLSSSIAERSDEYGEAVSAAILDAWQKGSS